MRMPQIFWFNWFEIVERHSMTTKIGLDFFSLSLKVWDRFENEVRGLILKPTLRLSFRFTVVNLLFYFASFLIFLVFFLFLYYPFDMV